MPNADDHGRFCGLAASSRLGHGNTLSFETTTDEVSVAEMGRWHTTVWKPVGCVNIDAQYIGFESNIHLCALSRHHQGNLFLYRPIQRRRKSLVPTKRACFFLSKVFQPNKKQYGVATGYCTANDGPVGQGNPVGESGPAFRYALSVATDQP